MSDEQSYKISRTGDDVILSFHGHYQADDVDKTVSDFARLIGDDHGIRFIVDLGTMSGYDKYAREVWAKVLPRYKGQLHGIIFVGNSNPIIKMAAFTIAMIAKIPMQSVASWGDVPPR